MDILKYFKTIFWLIFLSSLALPVNAEDNKIVKDKDKVTNILEKGSVFYEILGKTQKDSLELDGEFNIKLSELNKLNSLWFKEFFKEK